MGFDKAAILADGLPNAVRLARALLQVVEVAVEVGPGRSGLPSVMEDPPGAGPLVALSAGVSALERAGHRGPALLVACDLPLLSAAALKAIAGRPELASVVPLVNGRLQPLCARWSAGDLALAVRLAAGGARSMRALLDTAVFVSFRPADWPVWMGEEVFSDADTPADLRNLGLSGDP
jgi:molybdopterin-guanine dinucleotide biosynthesis protein A